MQLQRKLTLGALGALSALSALGALSALSAPRASFLCNYIIIPWLGPCRKEECTKFSAMGPLDMELQCASEPLLSHADRVAAGWDADWCPSVESSHRAFKDSHLEALGAPIVSRQPPVERKYIVRVSRSQPRLKTGEIAFECQYDDDDFTVKRPLTSFFDTTTWYCSDIEVSEAVNSWIETAAEWPLVRRKCITCKTKAVKSQVLCGRCDKKWGACIYA